MRGQVYPNGDPRNPCNFCGETRGIHAKGCAAASAPTGVQHSDLHELLSDLSDDLR